MSNSTKNRFYQVVILAGVLAVVFVAVHILDAFGNVYVVNP